MYSTKIYSDIDIHRILNWKKYQINDIIDSIKRISKQPFDKLLIILDDLMKIIFEIMLISKDISLKESTFNALVSIFGEINKGVNIKYHNKIIKWIKNYFKYPYIWKYYLYNY